MLAGIAAIGVIALFAGTAKLRRRYMRFYPYVAGGALFARLFGLQGGGYVMSRLFNAVFALILVPFVFLVFYWW